ncbi:sulfotransferase 2A1-like [Oppia nitens]|uniref:sulfotransferase 2A1-like n=1 Tax=Oppia nitens TaxID=1686743 RepID=UPI0023DC9308|nr:sulfotransferase 2A1-like [Oppia nitens]
MADKLEHRPNYRFIYAKYRCGSNWLLYIVQLILSGATNTRPVNDIDYIMEINGRQVLGATHRKMLGRQSVRIDNTSASDNTSNNNSNNNMTKEEEVVVFKRFQSIDTLTTDSKARYLLLMRNPKDVLIAYYVLKLKTLKLRHPELNIAETDDYKLFGRLLDYWLSDEFERKWGYFAYYRHYWQYRHLMIPNFYVLTYETMKRQPRTAIETIAKFLGHTYHKQLNQVLNTMTGETLLDRIERLSTINIMKPIFDRQDNRKVRKGMIGDWRTYLTREQSDAIDRRIAREWSGTGLEFLWEQEMKWIDK